MKKKLNLILLCCSFLMLSALFIGVDNSKAESLPVISQTSSSKITSGMDLLNYNSVSGGGTAKVYVLKVDLSNPYIKLDTIVGSDGTFSQNQPLSKMASNVRAVGAINGDFFQIGTTGRPIGLTYNNGSLISTPTLRDDMYGFGLTQNKIPTIEIFTFSGEVFAPNGNTFALSGINKPEYLVSGGASSDKDALQMYNTDWGSYSRGGGSGVVEMVVKNGVVQEIRDNKEAVAIPYGGYVLRGKGLAATFLKDNFKASDEVKFSYNVGPTEDILAAVGGQALLISKGIIPNYFTQEIPGRVSRTALGYSQDKKTIYLACAEKSSKSQGMTQWEMAYFLSNIGAYWAVNLDGGGSTTMVARPIFETELSLINTPQGGTQRNIPTAIGIFSTAPKGKLTDLLPEYQNKALVGLSYNFTAKGIDEYYNPYSFNQNELVLEIKNGEGNISGNTIVFEKGGNTTIDMGNNDYREDISLTVYDENDIASLDIEPKEINLTPLGKVNLNVIVNCKDGSQFSLGADHYQLSLLDVGGEVSGNTYTAPSSIDFGSLKISFRDYSQTIPIKVSEEQQVIGKITVDNGLSLKADDLTLTIPSGALTTNTVVGLKIVASVENSLPENYSLVKGIAITTNNNSNPSLPIQLSWNSNEALLMQWQEDKWVILEDGKITDFSPLALVTLKIIDSTSFKDIENHWAKEDIQNLAQLGIVSGFPNNLFMPQDKVTRVQFVTILAKALGWEGIELNKSFTDKDGIPDWGKNFIGIAVEKGVINGYEDNSFRPNRNITRSEMAAIISKALALSETSEDILKNFTDYQNIDSWAIDPLAKVVGAGLLKGDNYQQLNPVGLASRAESASLIARVMERVTPLIENEN